MNRIILLTLIVTFAGLLVVVRQSCAQHRHVHCETRDDCIRNNACPNPASSWCDRTGHCRCNRSNTTVCSDSATCVRSCQRPDACCNRFRRCQCDRPCMDRATTVRN
ncbi:hypothetical protein Btru_071120 [Bulinus truncatus]|nr:hypothetical protein Btru_071120 [Bulinus truncatus]